MGHERALPGVLAWISRRGVPLSSIILAFVVGEIAFLPFPSWQSLVGLVTDATAIMYAFAPLSLHALRLRDGDRPRPYRLPMWQVLSPLAFVAADLIIYWSGFEANWKLGITMLVGLAVFAVNRLRAPESHPPLYWRSSLWVWPWLGGMTVIGWLGRYGGGDGVLGNWWDLLVVIVFSLVVYYAAVPLAMDSAAVETAVTAEERTEYPEAVAGA
jgi:amino acid transporter